MRDDTLVNMNFGTLWSLVVVLAQRMPPALGADLGTEQYTHEMKTAVPAEWRSGGYVGSYIELMVLPLGT